MELGDLIDALNPDIDIRVISWAYDPQDEKELYAGTAGKFWAAIVGNARRWAIKELEVTGVDIDSDVMYVYV